MVKAAHPVQTLNRGWHYLLLHKCISCVVSTWSLSGKRRDMNLCHVHSILFLFFLKIKIGFSCFSDKAMKVLLCCLDSEATETCCMGVSGLWALLHNNQRVHAHMRTHTGIQTLNFANILSVLLVFSKGQDKTEVSHGSTKNPRGTRPLKEGYTSIHFNVICWCFSWLWFFLSCKPQNWRTNRNPPRPTCWSAWKISPSC